MNDQHITAVATIVQDFLLLASAALIAWYLLETRKMRKAAEEQVKESQALVIAAQKQLDAGHEQVKASLRQVAAAYEQTAVAQEQLESQIRPAIVVRHGHAGRGLELVNLGTGPALHLGLFATERGSGPRCDLDCLVDGDIGFIETGGNWQTNVRTQGVTLSSLNGRSLQCEYTSLSGRTYWTIVDFDHANNNLLIATRFFNADSSEL